MDIVDVTGVHVVDVGGKLFKHGTNSKGELIHGGKDMISDRSIDFANHTEEQVLNETIMALDRQEGCIIEGNMVINKVPGNFHLSSHNHGPVVQKLYMSGRRLDFSHTIKHLSFGDDVQSKVL